MTVTPDQARMLTELARASRPTGARTWDSAGVMSAIKQVAHWSLPELMVEVATAAADRNAHTPAVIGKQGRRWRENVEYVPDVRRGEARCWRCGIYDGPRHPDDHAFTEPTERMEPERLHKIVDAVRAEVAPTAEPTPRKTLDDLMPAVRDPRLDEIRAQLAREPEVEEVTA